MDKNLRIYTERRIENRYQKFLRKLSLTNWLIIINLVIFLLYSLAIIALGQGGEEKLASLFALQANTFFSGQIWTLFTSMFLHAGLGHLFFNMISLFFIGNLVEKIIGRKRFLWLYLISGLFAGLFYVTLSYFFGNITVVLGGMNYNLGEKLFLNPTTYAVGASGAIFSLVGLLAVLTPYNRVYLISGPLIAIIIDAVLINLFPNSSLVSTLGLIINVYFIFTIFAMFSFNKNIRRIALPIEMPFWVLPVIAIVPLIIIGLFVPLPIGNTAHLGGLIAGLFYAGYLRNKYRRKTEIISKAFR